MQKIKNSPNNIHRNSEFSLGKDEFEESRTKGTYAWILKHVLFKSNKILIVLFLLLSLLASFTGSYLMILIGEAIGAFGTVNSQIMEHTFKVLVFAVGTPLLGLLSRISREIVAQKLERTVRREFYLSLLSKSQSFHDRQRLGDLMARATNDVRLLNFLISPGISVLFDSIINLIIPIIMIMIFYPIQLTVIPIIFAILFIFSLNNYVKKLKPLMTGRRIEFGNMNAILNESLSGIEIVKSSALELESIEKYRESAISYKTFGIKSGYVRAKFYPLLYIGIVITLGLIYSIFLYNNAILSLGQVIGYLGVLGRLRLPTNMSNHAFFMIQRAKAGADRLVETMNTKSEITEPQDSITHQIEGKVEFKGVSFNYPGTKNKVLKNISFQIQPGQVIAIVGTTGSGKTTLTKLISRLYDISEGQILIDGIDVREYSLNSLRDQISYIEQDVFLFSKSVNENIAFGKYSFSKAKIKEVAKEAQAHDFIMNLPNQYETEVGERGVKLSGGEKQRIAIARAFLSDPKILVLDDASSAIDSKTEEKIQKAILKVLSNRTTLLITHRLSQIRWADLILVLKRGEIVARGTHNELLQSSEEYREIFIRKFDKTLNELLKTDLKKTEMREN